MTTPTTASAARPRGKQPAMFGFEVGITLEQITERHHFRVVRDAKAVSIIEVTDCARTLIIRLRAI